MPESGYIRVYRMNVWAPHVVLVVKNPLPVQEPQETGSVPGSGKPPGEGNGNPLQYSCLGNPVDRRVWWTIVHGVTKNWT